MGDLLKAFDILEHTADVGVRARGRTMPELFENAFAGMAEIGYEREGVVEIESRPIRATAADREALLVNFLDEVLWILDGEGLLLRRVAVDQISDTEACATAFGEARDPARHNIRMLIKAVTYHQLSVRSTPDGWEAEVYFDI